MKGQFFSELEGKWAHLCSYREDLIASEEMSSEESELMDVLGYLFSSDLTDTKKDSIQMLCVLVLASVNDGLLCLKNIEFDKAAMHMSNAYQALFHIRSDCEAFVSGRSRGGQLRHLNDPKSKDKKLVFECWEAWQKDPGRYKTVAKFARDVLDKTEHLAGDPQVIYRWVRGWRKGVQ